MKISLKFVHSIQQRISIIGLDNGLVLVKQQAIIWTNDGLA